MLKTRFQCRRGSYTVRGVVYRPEGENLPIAVVSHAFLCNMRSTRRYAQALADMGYAAFCFDFVGGSVWNRSSGLLRDMTVFTEVDDLKAVIAFARSQRYTDGSRLTLMGCSQGAFVSALTAAELKDEVEKLVLFYPALCIPEDARKGEMLFFFFDPKNVPPLIRAKKHLMHLGREYPLCVMDMDAYAAITPYTGKTLLLYGTEDEVVPQRCFKKAERAYLEAGTALRAVCLPGAKHGFSPEEDKTALQEVRSFLLDGKEQDA